MKKIYVMPQTEVIRLNTHTILAGSTTETEGLEGVMPGTGDKPSGFAKDHNSIWEDEIDL